MKTSTLNIMGMNCPKCAKAVEDKLLGTPGVSRARVDIPTNTAQIDYDDFVCNMSTLLAAISDAGYNVSGFNTPVVGADQ